jgi:predicted nucleotidyltransferase
VTESTLDRDATLARVIELLEADPRIEAAVITGSLGTGRADRWSDIDIAAVVSDADSCESVTADWVALIYGEMLVAHHYETAFDTTLVRGFLLNSGLVVDLGFTPSADFSVWAPVTVAFDRTGVATRLAEVPQPWTVAPDWQAEAGFAWHDALHAIAAANRGRSWQALYFLQRLRNRTLVLATQRHGMDADEFKSVDDLPAEERDRLLTSLVGELSQPSLLGAIESTTLAFLDELRHWDRALADRLAHPLLTSLRVMGGTGDAGERH